MDGVEHAVDAIILGTGFRATTITTSLPYSPSLRSGAFSSGSASSISLVKIRSERW